MKRGIHWIEVPGDGPRNGLPWAWRWVCNAHGRRLGIALVKPGWALFLLWSPTAPLNTMRVMPNE